ncbi:MAG: tetratricopeptide repeat protein, partial [Gemmatimonadetes bacterium]|nr:tetratricopeptide repeat protein [Gemmatimonadota bacterium]
LVGPWGAAIGGAVFAVHPVHTEAVANVVGRAEILAAACWFAVLLLCLAPGRDGGSSEDGKLTVTSPGAAIAAGLFYLLAIFAKESAIVLPALVLLMDSVRVRWRGLRDLGVYLYARRRLYLALGVAGVLALLARLEVLGAAVGSDRPATFGHESDYATRFFTMIRIWPHYLRLLLTPFELLADYSPAVILPVHSMTPLGLLGLAVAVVTLALGLALWKRAPIVSRGIFWVPIALLPVSNLVILSGVILAERTLYLPSAGLSFVAAGLVPAAMGSPRTRRAGFVAVLAVLAAFTVMTVQRNPVWKETGTLFTTVLRAHPESYKAQWVLANSLAARGAWEEAEERYRIALRIWPYDEALWTELAAQYFRQGEWKKSEEAARRAIAVNPAAAPIHFLTMALLEQKRYDEAAIAARRGVEAMGEDGLLYYLLSRARERQGRYRSAADALRASVAVQEGNWFAWYHIARLYRLAGDVPWAHAALDSAEAKLPAAAGPAGPAGMVSALRDSLGSR